MNSRWICAVVLGGAAMLGAAHAKAQSQDDKTFVMNASQSDYNEIQFAQLAQQKASSPKVKQFAQKMITDHTTLETQMKPFADKLGVTPATSLDSEHQQLYTTLQGLSGTQFDQQYMQSQVQDHQKALDLFKQEISTTQDSSMKPTLKKGESVVAKHLKMAQGMVAKMGSSTTGTSSGTM